ncbi:MAG: TetR/AcrR family transcriptional regulator [Myxococcales bacterium]|nr:TetR/AcrR family transcriptional regulator [Myxococcales bacterium]
MPSPRRDGAATRARLLDAATTLFADVGFEGASTRELATAAGANPALIRHHFGDKLGLFRAAAGRALETLETAHRAELHRLGSGAELQALSAVLALHRHELRMLAAALLAVGEPRDWLLAEHTPRLLEAARWLARDRAPGRPLDGAPLQAWLCALVAVPLLGDLLEAGSPSQVLTQLDDWLRRGQVPAAPAGEWSIAAARRRRLRPPAPSGAGSPP